MEYKVSNYISTKDTIITDAMKKIDAGAKGILFVVDDDEHLIGCVTDGDIRRWLIETGDLSATIQCCMSSHPKFVTEEVDASNYSSILDKYQIKMLPVLDINRKIVDIVCEKKGPESHRDVNAKSLRDVPVVIMAGGKGTRLYPYTKILPKPLIPIGDVPIIERIIDRFAAYGADKFWLTVNYKKGMIKSYFDELNPSYDLVYVEETQPLGTGGSLCLIEEKFSKPVIVTNCDILIETELDDIYQQHVEEGNDITIVAAMKNTTIPYGVLNIKEQGVVEGIEEKPVYSHLINTGMYVVNQDMLDLIPKDKFYHMTNLVEDAISRGYKVGMYPVGEDSFLDMGEIEEMKRMEQRLFKG